MNFFKWYNLRIQKTPILTKCITSFTTFSIGDLICQQIERSSDKNKKFNFLRTFKQGSFGFLVHHIYIYNFV